MRWHYEGTAFGWPAVDHRRLWLLGILFFGVGDLLTTGLGLATAGVTEANPIVAAAVGDDLVVMGALKALTLGGCLLLWTVIPRPHSVGIPLALTVVGVFVTAWNLHVLLRALYDPALVALPSLL